MTVTKGLALFVLVTLAGVLVRASGVAAWLAPAAPRLTAISSPAHRQGASPPTIPAPAYRRSDTR